LPNLLKHGRMKESSRQEEQTYPMNKVKVDVRTYTILELKRLFDAVPGRILLDSGFQRKDIWCQEDKSKLIESVLKGFPISIFYFSQNKYGNLIVIDGKQRLNTFFSYMNDDFPLEKLRTLPEENSKRFSDLSHLLQGRIEDFLIEAYVIMPPTPDQVKLDLFERVNCGGVPLNKQEMRNVLYQGEATRILKRLAESEAFKNATGGAFLNEKRMKDQYILIRFITLFLYSDQKIRDEKGEICSYKKHIDSFWEKGMETLNRMKEQEIQEIEQMVLETLEKSYFYLGRDAFRLPKGKRKSPINMNVFETVMYIMRYVPENNEQLRPRINQRISKFLGSDRFRDNIGNHRDSEEKIKWRLKKAETIGRSLAKDD